jgi:hypothetical protein
MSLDATSAALEYALRVVLAAALAIHSILDITDPITGAKSYALKIEDSIPRWLLPAVGILRAMAAVAIMSENPSAVLGALAYCSTLWWGAAYFHVRVKHHPAVALPAIMFVVLAAIVTALRFNLWFAFWARQCALWLRAAWVEFSLLLLRTARHPCWINNTRLLSDADRSVGKVGSPGFCIMLYTLAMLGHRNILKCLCKSNRCYPRTANEPVYYTNPFDFSGNST